MDERRGMHPRTQWGRHWGGEKKKSLYVISTIFPWPRCVYGDEIDGWKNGSKEKRNERANPLVTL